MASEAEISKAEAVTNPPRAIEFGPTNCRRDSTGHTKGAQYRQREGLMVEVTASDVQRVATSKQYSPVVSTTLNSANLHIPEQCGQIPVVTVNDSYGTRLLSSSEVLAVQSAMTGLAPASPSSTTMATTQMLTMSMAQGTPTSLPTAEQMSKVRKSSKKKSKKEKHRDKLPTLASMVGRRTSPGKSTKSPKKKRHSFQIACASSMLTSHVAHEEEEDTQNSKKR